MVEDTRKLGTVKVLMLVPTGDDVHGIPSGGTAGQVLTKSGDSDYEVIWSTLKNSRAVELSETNIQTEVGTAKTVTVKYRVAGNSDTAAYTSSDTSVATVAVTGHSSTGTSATDVITITPVANGDCTIKIAFANEVGYDAEYDYINVTVGTASSGKQTTIIDLSESNVVLDESLTDTVTVTYSGAAATFTSSDTSVATVDVTSASAVGNTYTYVITITAKKEGACSIEVDVPENSSYYGAKAYINVTVATAIYGAEWDGSSSPAWTRTDMATNFVDPVPYYSGMSGTPSSPFDNIMPWAGLRRVEDAEAGSLVEIPKFYYKWTRSGAKMKLQISMKPFAGSHVSPAHADRGDGVGERDYVYVGRYHCASDYKSKSGVAPLPNKTRAEFRSGISALGNDVWQWDYAMLRTIQILYQAEFANWNSQVKIGYGCGNNSAVKNNGASDSMSYHTGTIQNARNTYGAGVQYRYIENLWSNVYDWVDGIYADASNIYCIKNPANFSDTTGGTNVGDNIGGTTGLIKSYSEPTASGFEYALMPKTTENNNTYDTYVTDQYYHANNQVVFASGGAFSQGRGQGLFYLFGDSASSIYNSTGSRLMKLPANRL